MIACFNPFTNSHYSPIHNKAYKILLNKESRGPLASSKQTITLVLEPSLFDWSPTHHNLKNMESQ